jgi:glutamine amidotransferase
MCELFGFSSKHPLIASELPLAEFRMHGGALADNPDGWGMVWREREAWQLEKEPLPGSHSARFDSLISTVQSDLIVAHVRKARLPPVNTLGNTHPFIHGCCERQWAFAHNGMVPEVAAAEAALCNAMCRPDGQTDSEFAFCHLLSHLVGHYHTAGANAQWLGILSDVSAQIAAHGKFNFLLSDGQLLIGYGHDRLHYRESTDAANPSVVVATEPLGNATSWTEFAPGELRLYQDGVPIRQLLTAF